MWFELPVNHPDHIIPDRLQAEVVNPAVGHCGRKKLTPLQVKVPDTVDVEHKLIRVHARAIVPEVKRAPVEIRN